MIFAQLIYPSTISVNPHLVLDMLSIPGLQIIPRQCLKRCIVHQEDQIQSGSQFEIKCIHNRQSTHPHMRRMSERTLQDVTLKQNSFSFFPLSL